MVKVEKQIDNYGKNMVLASLVLFVILLSIFYKLQQNGQNEPMIYNALAPVGESRKIYLLRSTTTAYVHHQNSSNKSNYKVKLDRLKSYIKTATSYKAEFIDEDDLDTLTSDDILIVSDAIALKDETKDSIKNFLTNGGNLFFNFTTGFSDESGNFIGANFVEDITKLKISTDRSYLYFKEGLNLTQRLVSVLDNRDDGVLLDAAVYDNIPIFITPKEIRADIYMTNYAQTNPPMDKNQNNSLSLDEAGCAWHGYYGKGKWFYSNLPSYIFYDSKKENYKSIMNSIINYLANDVVIEKFPYIDKERVVFISEDTEYKFENFKKFSNLAKKYQIPVTAFIVSGIAQKEENKEMVKRISRNHYVEFASHSHSHKKIVGMDEEYIKKETADTKIAIDRVSSHPITGFRPPREELDDMMKLYLSSGDFRYVLGASQEYLYPRYDEKQDNLLLIPRHGTDDYSYLINLDWGQDQIVEQMIKETNFVTNLDALYTLSIHTHLFAFKSNIKIVEKYFKYLKKHREFTPLDGRTIAKKVKQSKNIELSYEKSDDTVILTIINNNNRGIKDLHCKLFKNPNMKIVSLRSREGTVRKIAKDRSAVDLKVNYISANSATTIYIKLKERK
jgi:peptidoglycan/xylan/chitin deacetylase (PgdA/CDA1 family)